MGVTTASAPAQVVPDRNPVGGPFFPDQEVVESGRVSELVLAEARKPACRLPDGLYNECHPKPWPDFWGLRHEGVFHDRWPLVC